MPCYHPIPAWRGEKNPSGKRKIVFNKKNAKDSGLELQIPCGQCIGCRLERSRQWAMRCLHEADLYKRNAFVTLTYDDMHLPSDGSLDVRDFQLFMKRLRKAYPRDRIRYYHCGEYGDMGKRPHYHACLFNFDFDDKILWSVREGNNLYVSPSLNSIWGKGYCIIGEVTFDSAAYVARYIMKKVNGEKADDHYQGLKPEYTTMSRRPGIGKGWYEKFKDDVFPHDYVVIKGRKVHPPKYYDNLLQKEDIEVFEEIKRNRDKKSKYIYSNIQRLAGLPSTREDNTDDRLRVKEYIKKSKAKEMKRHYESSEL